jgi:F-box/TPR repeat protein Pof3
MRGPMFKKKVNKEQVATLQRAGQNAYKAGNLQAAIESFTQVRPGLFTSSSFRLTISTQALNENNEDIGVLDNRAATYCRLKQYSQARADARNMVKLAPNDDRVSINFNALCASKTN